MEVSLSVSTSPISVCVLALAKNDSPVLVPLRYSTTTSRSMAARTVTEVICFDRLPLTFANPEFKLTCTSTFDERERDGDLEWNRRDGT